jgi:hypothetical protein
VALGEAATGAADGGATLEALGAGTVGFCIEESESPPPRSAIWLFDIVRGMPPLPSENTRVVEPSGFVCIAPRFGRVSGAPGDALFGRGMFGAAAGVEGTLSGLPDSSAFWGVFFSAAR